MPPGATWSTLVWLPMKRVNKDIQKHQQWKNRASNASVSNPSWNLHCPQCNRVFMIRIGLNSHIHTHNMKTSQWLEVIALLNIKGQPSYLSIYLYVCVCMCVCGFFFSFTKLYWPICVMWCIKFYCRFLLLQVFNSTYIILDFCYL